MAVNTVLLDFSVDQSQVKNENNISILFTKVENILRDYLRNLKSMNNFHIEGSSIKVYTSDHATLTTVRIYNHGLLTINIEYYKNETQEAVISFDQSREIEEKLVTNISGIQRGQILVPIKRGASGRYFQSSDERLLEYDIDEIVFEERSPYQKVLIVHSRSLGNMLVLDDLQNISEADLIYTETLMCRGKEDYKDKEIVILGGGDGALLYELLKEKPKNVIMLELDEVVMKACNQHMKSICGDVLEARSGSNYHIITGDCTKGINMFISESRKFDYVFGDLTDIPISDSPTGEMWDFINKILQMSLKILKPTGKYLTHGNGVSCPEALKMYESQLNKLNPPIKFEKTTAFVPSFLEDWVFYQVSFAEKS